MSAGAPARLLAKSVRAGAEETPSHSVLGHSRDVARVAEALFARRALERWLRFFGLPEELREVFVLLLRVAALTHDIGKANEEFQRAVSQPGFHAQSVRHEHISALVLCMGEIQRWLGQHPALAARLPFLVGVVLSHHLKAASHGELRWGQTKGALRFEVYLDHPEVRALLEEVAQVAGLEPPPTLRCSQWEMSGGPWQALRDQEADLTYDLDELLEEPQERRLLCALKAALMVADAGGSGLARTGHALEGWIEENIHKPALRAEDLEDAVLAPYRAQVPGFVERDFQRGAAQVGPRGLLLAACGSGKTYAAWAWAREQLRAQALGHVIFLYPTRATATEGFRQYVAGAPEDAGALLHSASRYELERMLSNPPEGQEGRDFRLSEAQERLYSLGWWSRRYFAATADQFLSFMQFNYRALCMLPVLSDAALIIDEVHSYDRWMFEDLINFLRHFQAPVLCMTATLSASRRQQLEALGLRVFPSAGDGALADLEAQERHPRYAIQAVPAPPLAEALEAHRAGLRVLWVVNTVARAQELARALRAQAGGGAQALCYHSRFLLRDRQRIHGELIDAFGRGGSSAALAVTTQVCEMSLDLDADVLITEHAPPSALVQRLGRSNRHRSRGDDFRAQVYLYPPPDQRPYRTEEMSPVEGFVQQLAAGHVWSQAELAVALEDCALPERAPGEYSRLLDSGLYASPGDFRDIQPWLVSAALPGDVDEILARSASRRPLDDLLINAPARHVQSGAGERWPAWLGVVSEGCAYDPELGLLCPTGDDI